MPTPETTVENTETIIEDISQFLPMPGADSIVVPDVEKKPSLFDKKTTADLSFLDENVTEAKETVTSIIDEHIETTADPIKAEKGSLIDTFSKLFTEKTLIPFDDEKKLEEYTTKDWKELLEANIRDREEIVRQETPAKFFEALPDELKIAARYVSEGGQDMKGLFRALSQMEETKGLNPETDSPNIVRQYLQTTQFGTDDEIEAQIDEWTDFGTLEKKAAAFKPKIEKLQQDALQVHLERQEAFRKQQEAKAREFTDQVYTTLKTGNLNGTVLDKKTQSFLFNELTNANYNSLSGKQTNLLGHLLEEYQFIKPRYDLVAEALWLLSDPDAYREQIRQQGKNAAVIDTVRKLKTEESRKIPTTVEEEIEENKQRKLNRPQRNIFNRN